MKDQKPNKGSADLYHESYDRLFAAAPKELQDKILKNRADPTYFPKEVWAFIRAVVADAEKNGA